MESEKDRKKCVILLFDKEPIHKMALIDLESVNGHKFTHMINYGSQDDLRKIVG